MRFRRNGARLPTGMNMRTRLRTAKSKAANLYLSASSETHLPGGSPAFLAFALISFAGSIEIKVALRSSMYGARARPTLPVEAPTS